MWGAFHRPSGKSNVHCINSCSLWKNIGVDGTAASVKQLQFNFSWNIKNHLFFHRWRLPKRVIICFELLCQIPDAQPYQVGNVSSLLSMTSDLVQFATDLSQGSARRLPLSLEVSMMVWKWAAYKSTWWRQQIRWLRQSCLWQVLCDKICNFLVALGCIWLQVFFKVSFSGVESSQCSYCAELLNSRPHRITRVPTSTCLGRYQLMEDEKRMEKNAGIQSIHVNSIKTSDFSSYHISYHIVSSIIHQQKRLRLMPGRKRCLVVDCIGCICSRHLKDP